MTSVALAIGYVVLAVVGVFGCLLVAGAIISLIEGRGNND